MAASLDGADRSEREDVEHRRVALVLHLGRVDELGARGIARTRRNCEILLAVDREGHGRRREAGAAIDLPELLQGRVVEGRHGPVYESGEDEPTRGRKRAAVVWIGQSDRLLDLAGQRV